MKNDSQSIVDENGIEINVNFDYEKSEGYYEVPDNISSWVEESVEVDIKIVEIVIGGVGIDITHLLNEKQINIIKSKLDYE